MTSSLYYVLCSADWQLVFLWLSGVTLEDGRQIIPIRLTRTTS